MSRFASFGPRAGALLLATALAAVVGQGPLVHGPSAAAAALGPYDLRVGSFNVRSVTKDGTGDGLPWRDRRAAVVRDVLGERLDVLGVQEASQNPNYTDRLVDGSAQTQYVDLESGLNDAGGTFALTNRHGVNCKRDWTIYNCDYQYNGASGSTRILYNTSTLDLIDQGSFAYKNQTDGPNDTRYLAWATLRVKATGAEFFFANTHLSNGTASLQKAQTKELIAKVNQLRGSLPVVVVGDFQRSKFNNPIDYTLKAMKYAGYGDVVNQKFDYAYVDHPRAQRRVNGWFNTMNGFKRDVTGYAYEDKRTKAGNNIDWIWATNSLPVPEWKVVVHYDPDTLRLRGVIPSDHMMVRATVTLP